MVKSKVWLSLSKTAKDVFLIFRTKCQIAKRKGKPGKRGPVIINNGEIVFTYVEAKKKYGISASRFRRALDQLVEKGFIDIEATGMGVHKVTTLYAISERWRDYGTLHFKKAKRPEPIIANPGFRPGNKLWQKARAKNSSDENEHGAVNNNVHGELLAMYTNVHGEKITTQYKRIDDKWLACKIA